MSGLPAGRARQEPRRKRRRRGSKCLAVRPTPFDSVGSLFSTIIFTLRAGEKRTRGNGTTAHSSWAEDGALHRGAIQLTTMTSSTSEQLRGDDHAARPPARPPAGSSHSLPPSDGVVVEIFPFMRWAPLLLDRF